MTTDLMRQKLHDYLDVAEDKKVEAIYTLVESEFEIDYEWWDDKDFVTELNKRGNELASGEVKGISWEDVKKTLLGV